MNLLRAFEDSRYVTVDGKPLFLIYRWDEIPDVHGVTDLWRTMAVKSGLKGLHMVAVLHHKDTWVPEQHGFDACVRSYLRPPRERWISWRHPVKRLTRFYQEKTAKPTVYSYREVLLDVFPDKVADVEDYLCLMPNWDNTPRSGANGVVLHGSTAELFRIQVRKSLEITEGMPMEHRIIFIKSWNEWAEGNHLEPDLRFGKAYLEVIRDEIFK